VDKGSRRPVFGNQSSAVRGTPCRSAAMLRPPLSSTGRNERDASSTFSMGSSQYRSELPFRAFGPNGNQLCTGRYGQN
jgi:hypothetical protein